MDKMILILIGILGLLGFCVYKTRKRKGLSNFFLFLFVSLLVLLVSEFVYRHFFADRKTYNSSNSLYTGDPFTGFKWKDTGHVRVVQYFIGGDTIFNTHYTFLSDTTEPAKNYPFRKGYKSDSSGKEAVFLGCSLTFGECLADEETLPYQYGQKAGISTVNRACNGYGTHQVYELFKQKYASKDNHNRIFVYSFFRQHLLRANCIYSWNIAGPYYVISGDSLLYKGPTYNFKKIKWLRLAHYGSFMGALTILRDNIEKIATKKSINDLDENDMAPCYMMLKQMAAIIQRTGGKLIILDWDSNPGEYKNSKILCQDTITNNVNRAITPYGGRQLFVSSILKASDPANLVPGNGHPSALANKILAEFLASKIDLDK